VNELLRVGKDTDVRNSVNVNILGSLHKKCVHALRTTWYKQLYIQI